jgi:hypothetical protein
MEPTYKIFHRTVICNNDNGCGDYATMYIVMLPPTMGRQHIREPPDLRVFALDLVAVQFWDHANRQRSEFLD